MFRKICSAIVSSLLGGSLILLGAAPSLAQTTEPPVAAVECSGAAPAEVIGGVITVTCGADAGPGTLREAAELSSANDTPVSVRVSPDVGTIELDSRVTFDRWIDLLGNGSNSTTIRPSAVFPSDEALLSVNWAGNAEGAGAIAGLHIEVDSRAEVGLYFSFDGHAMTLEDLRVSGATRSGVRAEVYDGGSLTVRNSLFDSNGYGAGHGEHGGVVINEAQFEEAHADVLIENSEFRQNYQGLLAGLWYSPDTADSDESFQVVGSRFIGNGSLGGGNEVGALVLPWAEGPGAGGEARLKVIDSLFANNSGQAAGAIRLNSERGLKRPNPVGVSLLISGATFVDNVANADRWYDPASDLSFFPGEWPMGEEPDTQFLLQNSTFRNSGGLPSISVNENSGKIVFEHVTMTGGWVGADWGYPELQVMNSVIDSGEHESIGPGRKHPEDAPPVPNRGSVFTQPGRLVLGDGSFVASQSEIALGGILQGVGPTPTMLPQPGSVLLGAAVPGESSPAVDQRGLPRPDLTGGADIGAVEVQLGAVRILNDVAVDEGHPAVFAVDLMAPSEHPATVTAATRDGTAQAGTDYEATSTELSWAPGETGKRTVTVNTFADDAVRADRAFTLALSAAGGAAIVSPDSALGTIRDTSSAPGVPPRPPETPPHGGGNSGSQQPPGGPLSDTGAGQPSPLWALLAAAGLGAGALLLRGGFRRSL